MRKILYLSLAVLGICMGGCAGQAPLPVDHYYRLPDTDSLVQGSAQLGDSIYVAELDTDGLHRERAILFSEDEDAIELKQYHYHHWTDSPTRLVRDYLVSYLRNVKAADLVITSRDDPTDLRIGGKIARFERNNATGQPRALVELTLRLDRRNEASPLLLKVYSMSVSMEDESMHAAVRAFATGLSGIFSEFHADMRSVLE